MHVSAPLSRTQSVATQPPAERGTKWHLARWPWIFIALIAVINALTHPPLLSGGAAFLVSVILVLAALAGLPTLTIGFRQRSTFFAAGWVVITLFVVSQIGSTFIFRKWREPGLDFSAYYLAGKALRTAQPLYYLPTYPDGRMKLVYSVDPKSYWYRMAIEEGIVKTMQFNYPPLAAILFEPFTFVPFRLAFTVWTGLTALLLLGSIVVVLWFAQVRDRFAVFILAIIAVFSCAPVQSTFYYGQINAVLLFLWSLGVYLYTRNKHASSALCFALGTMIKITPLMVVPLMVLMRRWRWLAMYGLWMSLLLAATTAGTGWGNLQFYVSKVLPSMSCGAPYFDNRSVSALVQCSYLHWVPLWLEGPPTIPTAVCTAAKIITAAVFVGMVAVLYWNARRLQDATESLVLMALITLLVSPITWTHHYALAVLPLLYLWVVAWESSRAVFYATVFVTLLIGTNLALYTLAIIRYAGIDLILAALQPASVIVLIVVFAQQAHRKNDLSALPQP